MSGQAGFPAGIRAIDVTRALAGLPAGFGETAARRVKRRVGEIAAAAARDNLRKALWGRWCRRAARRQRLVAPAALAEAVAARHNVLVAEMILTAVLAREESRGPHRRLDFPDADDGQ